MPDTPLAKKLGLKPGQRALLLNAPSGYRETLGAPPDGVTVSETPDGRYDFVQLFARDRAELAERAPAALAATRPGGLLWFAYPKKTSKLNTDLNRDAGWGVVADAGWRPVTQIAIDDDWSALRFRPAAEVTSAGGDKWIALQSPAPHPSEEG